MTTKFQEKIGNNSACMRDISAILAANSGFSGQSYRMMSVKFYNDQLLLAWQQNLRQNSL